MSLSNHFKINGQFKIDTYGKDNQLKNTTDYFSNFITYTGLEYIKTFAFADCFRYVSLGSGITLNSIVVETTGLASGISKFQYIGGFQNDGCGTLALSQYDSKSCGYRISESGVTLTRGWRIPTGELFFDTGYGFKEFMVSPGRPYISGYDSDGNILPLCSCLEPASYSAPSVLGDVVGLESSDFYLAYPTICSSTKAFARVLKDIPVVKDDYLIVNYALSINFATGMRSFNLITDRSHTPYQPTTLDTQNWLSASGIYSIIHPGIKLINNGISTVTPAFNNIIGLTVGGVPRYGESFIPPLGNPLEPSTDSSNKAVYISNDNLQFIANDLSGGAYIVNSRGFPQSGLLRFNKNWITDNSTTLMDLGDNTINLPQYYKPRSEVTANFTEAYPDSTDYTIANSAANILGGNFIAQTILGNVSEAFGSITERTRTKNISFQFIDQSLAANMPVRALVYGYTFDDGSGPQYFPAFDTLFRPSGGNVIPLTGIYPDKSYQNPLDVLVLSPLSGYNFLDNNNILQIDLNLTWSSPCPPEVVGC